MSMIQMTTVNLADVEHDLLIVNAIKCGLSGSQFRIGFAIFA